MDNKELDFSELEHIAGGEASPEQIRHLINNYMWISKNQGVSLEQFIEALPLKYRSQEIIEFIRSTWDNVSPY